MKLLRYLALAAAAAAYWSPAAAADPCSLLSTADAAALIGQPGVKATAAGPEPDEDSGGQMTYCTYRAATSPNSAVVVSIVEFGSDAQARKQLTKELLLARIDDEKAKVSEESGLGEKSFYGVSATGAMYIFLKKGKVVGVAFGGSPAARANVSKDALLKAAQAAASKI